MHQYIKKNLSNNYNNCNTSITNKNKETKQYILNKDKYRSDNKCYNYALIRHNKEKVLCRLCTAVPYIRF